MAENASPFFVNPYRFDDPESDEPSSPRLDWHRRVVLDDDERVLWRDRVEVAGYLVTPDSTDLHWTLPRLAEVTVTDHRLAYVCTDWDFETAPSRNAGPRHRRWDRRPGNRVATGQIRWQWPVALRLLPARASTAERMLIVCEAVRSIEQPALSLTGGPLASAGSTRALAHLVRRAVAAFRLANPGTVELAPPERDALRVRAGVGLFADDLADPRRGVHLPGALPVEFSHRDDYYRRVVAPGQPQNRSRRLTGSAGRPLSVGPGPAS